MSLQLRSDYYGQQCRPPIGARAQKTLWAVRNGLFEYFKKLVNETTDRYSQITPSCSTRNLLLIRIIMYRRIVPLQEVIDVVASEPRLTPIVDILVTSKYVNISLSIYLLFMFIFLY